MTDSITIANRKTLVCYISLLIVAGGIYITTCAPTIVWHDSALFTWRIWNNDVAGDIGIALAHPLYILIGMALKYIPLGTFEYRLNLFSALCGAVAVANVFLLVRLWMLSFRPGIIAAITMMFAWTFWQHTAIAEVYTLYAAQMLTELIFLLMFLRLRKVTYLYCLAFLNGLSLANHDWALFTMFCYSVLLIIMVCQKQVKVKHVFLLPLAFAVGASPFLYLMVQDLIANGDIVATINSALFGTLWKSGVTNMSLSVKVVFENFIFIFLNFPTPNILLGIVGVVFLIKSKSDRCFSTVFLVLTAMYLVFAFRYGVVDRYAFFLPVYCYGAILIGIGAEVFLSGKRNPSWLYMIILLAIMPVLVYCFTPAVGRKFYPSLGQRRQLPYKEPYSYFLRPWKSGYRGADTFARQALEAVDENGIIWVDATVVHLMLYIQQAKELRQDVRITSKYYRGDNAPAPEYVDFDGLLDEASVYVVSPGRTYCPQYWLDNYEFIEAGPIYKVVDKKQ